jgi:hypothetical protein
VNAHEVRKIKLCILCSRAGIHKPADPGIEFPLLICVHSDAVAKRDRRYVHPRCYVREMGIKKLVTLPMAELETIRMSDVSKQTMKAILRVDRVNRVAVTV